MPTTQQKKAHWPSPMNCGSCPHRLPLLPSGPDGVGRTSIAQIGDEPDGLPERVGFEPTVPGLSTLAFQACTFGPSVISPGHCAQSGESGIRTHGASIRGSTDFESARFNRSRISPCNANPVGSRGVCVPKRTRTSDL